MAANGKFCVNVPNGHAVRSIGIDYNGRGTQTGDIAIVGIVFGALVLLTILLAYIARRA